MFTEALLLTGAGSLSGIPMALTLTDAVQALTPNLSVAQPDPIEMRGRTLLFVLASCLTAALACGVAPALLLLRADVLEGLKDSGRSGGLGRQSNRVRNILVVAEVALALVVLVGAGLFTRSYRHLRWSDTGFRAKDVLLASLYAASGGYTAPELQTSSA